MKTGTIQAWYYKEGTNERIGAWIKTDEGTKVNLHHKNFKGDISSLELGEQVEFEIRELSISPGNFHAENCQLLKTMPTHSTTGAVSTAFGNSLNSTETSSSVSEAKTHLILTVGTNAIPVWVAWYHLKEELNNPKVTFVYTHETEDTVECLKSYFKGVEDKDFVEIPPTDPGDPKEIRGTIKDELLCKLQPNAPIHVHYTGGTQVMGVETVLAIAKERGGSFERSYLNARSSSVPTIVNQDGNSLGPKDARRGICPDIKRIAELNGFQYISSQGPQGSVGTGFDTLKKFFLTSNSWLKCFAWNALEHALKKIAGSNNDRENYKVFHDVRVKPNEGNSHFTLDIVAVLGYQVIVVSCSTLFKEYGSEKYDRFKSQGEVKEEAIIAYHQAKQLGGDEARAVVLCGLDKKGAKEVQDELYNDIGSEDVPLQIWGDNTWNSLDKRFHEYIRKDVGWHSINSEATSTSEEASVEDEQETQEETSNNDKSRNHLVFTVGTNALPIWVAWKYLKKELRNPQVGFVYTDQTEKMVECLKTHFKCESAEDENFVDICVEDPGNPKVIRDAISSKLLCKLGAGSSVHVHYTGGTQAMGVETVLAIATNRRDNSFEHSYLNARSDSGPTIVDQDGESIEPKDARQEICPDIKRIAELNGFEVSDEKFRKDALPIPPQNFASDCLESSDSAKLEAASAILKNYQKISQTIGEVRKYLCRPNEDPDDIWENCILPKLNAAYTEDRDKKEFLKGFWLEYAALAALRHALQQIKCSRKSQAYSRDNYAFFRNMYVRRKSEPGGVQSSEGPKKFELDVVVVLGYQVIVVSCSTSSGKSLIRLKAMEAYHRAKQLGGDEARAIMLCDLKDGQNLENELKDDIGSKDVPLQVWGRETWTWLPDKFKGYLKDLYWKERDD